MSSSSDRDENTIYISQTLFEHLKQKQDRGVSKQRRQEQQQHRSHHHHNQNQNRHHYNPTPPSSLLQEPNMSPESSLFHTTQRAPDTPTFDPNYLMRHAAFDPSMLLLGIRGEYEHKFQQYQLLWRQKWDELNRINIEIQKANSTRLTNEVDRVEKLYFQNEQCLEPPCQKLESSILECYQQNKNKPLVCNQLVKQFADCIETNRSKVLNQK